MHQLVLAYEEINFTFSSFSLVEGFMEKLLQTDPIYNIKIEKIN